MNLITTKIKLIKKVLNKFLTIYFINKKMMIKNSWIFLNRVIYKHFNS